MNINPMPVLAIIVLTLAFEGLVYGAGIAQSSFPESTQVSFGGCSFEPGGGIPFLSDVGEAVGYIGCLLGNAFNLVVNVFKVILGTVIFLYNLISFNIPGAPGFVRLIMGSLLGGGILLTVVAIFRGN